ncbi:STAM-binding protein-like [Schistocerca gregaria]|uniref:STAM-binding protein-like n=1 Tax=Schistocerca gregaria TaxID=7010 RepID=UPI00211F21FE|nr:STAM-binding protein-like [Schistocerca gregaria]
MKVTMKKGKQRVDSSGEACLEAAAKDTRKHGVEALSWLDKYNDEVGLNELIHAEDEAETACSEEVNLLQARYAKLRLEEELSRQTQEVERGPVKLDGRSRDEDDARREATVVQKRDSRAENGGPLIDTSARNKTDASAVPNCSRQKNKSTATSNTQSCAKSSTVFVPIDEELRRADDEFGLSCLVAFMTRGGEAPRSAESYRSFSARALKRSSVEGVQSAEGAPMGRSLPDSPVCKPAVSEVHSSGVERSKWSGRLASYSERDTKRSGGCEKVKSLPAEEANAAPSQKFASITHDKQGHLMASPHRPMPPSKAVRAPVETSQPPDTKSAVVLLSRAPLHPQLLDSPAPRLLSSPSNRVGPLAFNGFTDHNFLKNGTTSSFLTINLNKHAIFSFMDLAVSNTSRNIETCGLLAGAFVESQHQYQITHIILPKQMGTSDTCTTIDEFEVFNYQTKHQLLTMGWIHTHPTQPCFLSSVDMHTQYSYQMLFAGALAIVVAPTSDPPFAAFHLSDQGLKVMQSCNQGGFHYHGEGNLYQLCSHLSLVEDKTCIIKDLR